MFGPTRWNSFDDVFNFQREVDRLFNQFWSDLPTRTAAGSSPSFQVNPTDDGWRIDVPLPGIDPEDVALEVAGSTLTIRAEIPRSNTKDKNVARYEQTLTIPQFLDLEKLSREDKFEYFISYYILSYPVLLYFVLYCIFMFSLPSVDSRSVSSPLILNIPLLHPNINC